MTDYAFSSDAPRSRRRAVGEAVEFRLIYFATFHLFLAAALVRRVLPGRTRIVGKRSLFGEARGLAYATIPYAFM